MTRPGFESSATLSVFDRLIDHEPRNSKEAPLTRGQSVRQLKESLRRAILRGDLSGGERLIQADLATMLNVSTTPVREALRDLATEGLITLDRHRGGVVREPDWAEMEEIGLVLHQLEPLAVKLAFERISEAELQEAERLRLLMTKESDLGDWVELNTRFHLVFHNATGAASG